jgi:molybdopterin-guanine dinucleotide biosynthesis protein A
MWPHTVAILIGGQSKRMGSPKHLVRLHSGQTMLETMLQFASNLSRQVVILGGEVQGQHCIPDLRHEQGPVSGIEALLRSELDTKYLIVGCDMPSLTIESITPLVQCTNSALFSNNNRLLGLPLYVYGNVSAACSKYLDEGGRSIGGFVSQIENTVIPLHEKEAKTFLSINSPEDLDKFSLEQGG